MSDIKIPLPQTPEEQAVDAMTIMILDDAEELAAAIRKHTNVNQLAARLYACAAMQAFARLTIAEAMKRNPALPVHEVMGIQARVHARMETLLTAALEDPQ